MSRPHLAIDALTLKKKEKGFKLVPVEQRQDVKKNLFDTLHLWKSEKTTLMTFRYYLNQRALNPNKERKRKSPRNQIRKAEKLQKKRIF